MCEKQGCSRHFRGHFGQMLLPVGTMPLKTGVLEGSFNPEIKIADFQVKNKNMKLKNPLTALVLLTTAISVFGQDTTAKKPEASKIKPYAEVITAKAVSKPGLFIVHKIDEKYFFEIPDSLLQRELLATTRLVKVPAGSTKYGGEIVNAKTILFEKGFSNNIFLRVVTLVAVADSSNAIAKAVRNATIDPIVMVFDIKARGKDNASTVIEVTDFFQKDNIISGFDADAKKIMRVGGAAPDKSYILSVNPYPINIETRTVKTFTAGGGAQPAEGQATDPGAGVGVGVTMELSSSIMLMPAKPMQQRYFDPRVGYFADNYKVFSDDQQKVEDKTFIVRFRMEPKTEDLVKYKRGELVEPKEPIVYYVDPATPKQWRPYIIAGINDWNTAFEKAGFKNAIVGKEWPEHDTTMSLEDARYRVVRYFPSEARNAYGPNIHDPRSGEILQSYVGWYHNIMKLLHDMYFVQMSATDPRARSMKFSDQLMGSLIRAAVSHEIGHTLGLRHNMGASSQTPVEKLRDKKWVEAHGHTVSIMDYARFNYVAQPGDNITDKGIMPRIGDYDKWAIQWGYRYTGATPEEDKKVAAKLILDSLKANPRLWWASEPDSYDNPLDPRTQMEDIGDNSIKASEYGIKNLKVVMANVLAWTREENDIYDNAMDMYDKIGGQYQAYIKHVLANIGGTYETLKSVEQTGNIYTIVPKEIQKNAINFLNKEVFQTPSWLLDKNILNKYRKPIRYEWPQKIQEMTLNSILGLGRLYRMTTQNMRYGSEAYSVDEMLTDLNKGLWSELKTGQQMESYRRFVQKKYVELSIHLLRISAKKLNPDYDISNTDIPVALTNHLETVRKSCLAALPNYKDALTIAHLKYIADKIEKGLKLNGNDSSEF